MPTGNLFTRRGGIRSCVLFCAISLLLVIGYHRVTEIGFALADDDWMLLENSSVSDFFFDNNTFEQIFFRPYHIQYSPINTIYYAIIYRINGFDPYFFHLFSFCLHVINGALLYFLSKRLLIVFNYTENIKTIAFLVVSLWLIAPLNVESVVWISASKVLLSTTFSLLTFLFFINTSPKRKSCLVLSLICYLFACLSKEQSIAVVFMLAFYYVYCESKASKQLSKTSYYIYFVIGIGITALFVFITIKANEGAWVKMPFYPFSQRIVLAFCCLFFYIYNLFFPVDLHYHYPFPVSPGESLPVLYYLFPGLFILIIIVGRYLDYKPSRLVVFSIICFLINIGLTLQVLPMTRPAMMADRYMYFPSYFLLLASVTSLFKKTAESQYNKYYKMTLVLYVLVLACYTSHLVANWNVGIVK